MQGLTSTSLWQRDRNSLHTIRKHHEHSATLRMHGSVWSHTGKDIGGRGAARASSRSCANIVASAGSTFRTCKVAHATLRAYDLVLTRSPASGP
jgi:hypothetical protein